MAQPTPNMMAEAIAAARAGDRSRARDLLARMLRADSANAEYWVWMSAVVDTDRERIYCLESALNVDPTNRAALRGLVILGARKPQETKRQKTKVPRRRVTPVAQAASSGGLTFSWRMVGAALLGIVGLSLLGGIVLALRNLPFGTFIAPTLPPPTDTPTLTPEIPTATATPIPAETRVFRTPIPTELGATPLAFFVVATPTPTPILGMTPRPGYEAYGAGLSALQRGDYESAIDFFEQVIDLEPGLADVHYFLGEAYRMNGQPGQATIAYDRAVLTDNDFAPAFLGRGLARIDLARREDPDLTSSDLPPDFDSAIDRDPLLAEAYLAKAEFYSELRVWKGMSDTLQLAVDAGVREPIVYIRLSLALFNQGFYEPSLDAAIEGSANDPTNLEGYKAIGRGYLALEQYDQAIWPLETYLTYEGGDNTAWGYYARVLYELGDTDAAFAAVNEALALNDRYAYGYLTRALIMLERREYAAAEADLQQARRFGTENRDNILAFGRLYYYTGRYVDALQQINNAISMSERPDQRAIGYMYRALVYEATNPPLLDEAALNWQWIVDTEGASEETAELARVHLAALAGEGPTLTPTPEIATATPTAATPTPTP